MASPFSVFRRNKKVMFAVLGVLVMFAFVFLPMCDDVTFQSASPSNPVVVKTSQYGDLQESDLANLLREHRRILNVLADIRQAAGQYPAMAQREAEYTFGPAKEENVVNTWLLAQHGRQLGMVVSNEAVNAFLQRWSQDRVKPKELEAAFKRSGLTTLLFFNMVRDLLMAQQLREMFFVSLEGITPAQRWEYFTRIKRLATIEATGVDVADYVDQVDAPSDEKLTAFFEKYKDQYAVPGSPEPGFREPQKIALQWFKADRQKFLDQVTDEEIEERYLKNKELYQSLEQKAKESQPDEAKGLKEGEPAATPAEDAEPQKPTEEPQEPPPPQEPNQSDAAKPLEETSRQDRPSPFKLTALLQEGPAEEQDAAPPTEGVPAVKPADAPAAEDVPAVKPENAAATEEEKSPAADEAAKPTEPGMAEATRDRIRQEIANEKLMKVFEGLREKMDQYRNEWSKYEVAVIQQQDKKGGESKTPPTPPSPLDFAQLAEANGLSTGQTDLVSQWGAQSTDVGASLAGGRMPVWRFAFESLSKFRPEISLDLKGDLFLFWKIEETKDRVPKFEDEGVRDLVLQAWKLNEARPLALKEAEALVDQARQEKKSLKDLLADRPDRKVIEPLPFSWITFGNVPLGSAPEAARISEVPGVEFPGTDFMRTVFQLEPGQLGVAMNDPKSVAYAIQLDGFSPSRDVLWKEFEVDDFSKYAPAAAEEQREIVRAWFKELQTSAGMQWERDPDRMSEAGSDSE